MCPVHLQQFVPDDPLTVYDLDVNQILAGGSGVPVTPFLPVLDADDHNNITQLPNLDDIIPADLDYDQDLFNILNVSASNPDCGV